MFRKQIQILALLLIALCGFAASANAQSVPANCSQALNRNWICGVPNNNPNVAVSQCIATVVNGQIVSQGTRSFASVSALTTFLNNPPSGRTYQLCNATPQCTATTEKKSVACPAGQSGDIDYTRAVNVGGVCGATGEFVEVGNTCRTPPQSICTFNGQTLQEGQSVTAFKKVGSTTGIPGSYICTSETRTCHNGQLSGSFTDATCNDPTCTFNGQTLTEGQSVTAYKVNIVACPGNSTCESETRTCHAGVLSGSFTATTCPNFNACPPQVCTFNGQTLQNGQSVTAYQTQTTPYGSVCTSETRTCTAGVLSGSYTFATCSVNPPAICTLPNGGTIADGQSVTYYQAPTVANGQQCVSEVRICRNGVLSGTYASETCTVNPPPVCNLPYGGTIAEGQSVTVYKTSSVAYNQTCESETRTCHNGVLSGTFTAQSCNVTPPRICTTPWGMQLNSGQSVTAYLYRTAPSTTATAGDATATTTGTCISETRTCTDGSLSGSYTFQSCDVTPPTPQNCTLPYGGTLANGQSVTVYQTATVAYGQVCTSQTRTCNNGTLSGSYTFQNCTPAVPMQCTFNGQLLNDGQSVTAYRKIAQTNSIPASYLCESETRTCRNGVLSGSYTDATCQNPTCTADTETRSGVTACPAGQSGTITESRTTNVGGVCGQNGEWQVVSNTCTVNTPDIPTVMLNNPTIYSIFRHYLDIAGLIPGLSCPETGTCYGPFTVFAPRNEAFANLPAGYVTAMQDPTNAETLRQVLRTHIINGKYLKAFFTGKSTDIATQSGAIVNVNVPADGNNGTIGVVGSTDPRANVVEWDRMAKNGVIHTIDRVLNPPIVCAQGSEYVSGQYRCYPVCTNGTARDANGQCVSNTCTFNGQTLQNGQTVTAYKKVGQTNSIPGSYICQSETRTCTNGNLSGSYTDATCNDYVAPTCSINLQAGNYLNLNVLQLAQQQQCAIVPGVTVNLTILPGANIGSNDPGFPAFTSGTSWPTNVTINVVNYGRIQGAGGDGAYVEQDSGTMVPAQAGGAAISAPYPMIFNNASGQIWGGGGGGATIGFGHCSPAGGGGAGIIPGETFDPWGSCDINGNVVAANNNSGRVTRNGKNTNYLATAVTGADNEYMIRSIGGDVNAAYYVSGPGGNPGQAGGNAHYYIRNTFPQPYGTPFSTITGYYFYPTFSVNAPLNVTGGDAGIAIGDPQNVTFTNNTVGDRRGRDYPTNPARIPTPQPPLEQSCTATTETRTVACPAGQNGIDTQSRTVNANGVCGATTEWTDTNNTCAPPATCTFNGQTLQDGQTVTAYQANSVAYGGTCQYETRTCHNGTLSGSYGFANCQPQQPATCTFNGMTIQNGQSVTAYQGNSVGYGQTCVSESRFCNNGTLSGSYQFSSCNVTPPQNCTFNGATIGNGQTVTAYRYSSVVYGDTCQGGNVETRLCTNGVLSGSFTNPSCSVDQARSCTGPDGRTIPNGQSVTYYAGSGGGENVACQGETRTCNNGTLYGSFASSTCSQTMCTYAQAGDAIAKSCITTTYHNGAQSGTSYSNGNGGTSTGGSSSSNGGSVVVNNTNTNNNSVSTATSSSSNGNSVVYINGVRQ